MCSSSIFRWGRRFDAVQLLPHGRGSVTRFLCPVFLVSLHQSFCSAEIIDRIVITVGNQVITQSQVDDEIRVTAFLNHEKVDLSAAARKQAASRLIEQALIKREMDLSRYPLPGAERCRRIAGEPEGYVSQRN